MIDFAVMICAFVVALGILVTFHEFGHFWVARRVGVKILRFSIGFGKPIWTCTFGEDKTEFVIAALPLGGYVKMLDEREGEVSEHERHRAFTQQSLLHRTAIVIAGPAANFILAIFTYWLMYSIGVSGPRPIIGEVEPGSIAAAANLRTGHEIVEINGLQTPTWDNVFRISLEAILDAETVDLVIKEPGGFERATELDLTSVDIDDIANGGFFEELGIEPMRPYIPAVIGRLLPGEAAVLAGLKPHDVIKKVNGERVKDWRGWVEVIRAHPQEQLMITLERNGVILELALVPKLSVFEGQRIGRIGAEVAHYDDYEPLPIGIERYGFFDGFFRALQQTRTVAFTTLKFLRKMITGQASVKNLSGPISIAKYAGQSAKMGLTRFLDFLGLVSISLGILNLLPIPLLDGGHLLYYLVESITRRPVSETVQVIGQQIGLVLLLGLMSLAVYNDIMRIM